MNKDEDELLSPPGLIRVALAEGGETRDLTARIERARTYAAEREHCLIVQRNGDEEILVTLKEIEAGG